MSAVNAIPHRQVIEQALPALGVSLSGDAITALLSYLELIQKWTKVYNLTAVRDPAEMLTHHLLDSLAALAPLDRQLQSLRVATPGAPIRLLDVGSGAGLPGIVIAICRPTLLCTVWTPWERRPPLSNRLRQP